MHQSLVQLISGDTCSRTISAPRRKRRQAAAIWQRYSLSSRSTASQLFEARNLDAQQILNNTVAAYTDAASYDQGSEAVSLQREVARRKRSCDTRRSDSCRRAAGRFERASDSRRQASRCPFDRAYAADATPPRFPWAPSAVWSSTGVWPQRNATVAEATIERGVARSVSDRNTQRFRWVEGDRVLIWMNWPSPVLGGGARRIFELSSGSGPPPRRRRTRHPAATTVAGYHKGDAGRLSNRWKIIWRRSVSTRKRSSGTPQ